MPYQPTKNDIRWLKNLMSMLRLSGVWCYKNLPIICQKADETTLALLTAGKGTEEDIETLKTVALACGFKFEDRRTNNN